MEAELKSKKEKKKIVDGVDEQVRRAISQLYQDKEAKMSEREIEEVVKSIDELLVNSEKPPIISILLGKRISTLPDVAVRKLVRVYLKNKTNSPQGEFDFSENNQIALLSEDEEKLVEFWEKKLGDKLK